MDTISTLTELESQLQTLFNMDLTDLMDELLLDYEVQLLRAWKSNDPYVMTRSIEINERLNELEELDTITSDQFEEKVFLITLSGSFDAVMKFEFD